MLIDQSRGERGTIFGHDARGKMQWRDSFPDSQGLAIFLGPDAYISPRWYETKKETGKVVPTWNYVAIHARVQVNFFEDTERIREIVRKLTTCHEADSTEPWQVTDAPADYVNGELRQIVGFEMPVSSIEGKWKMSQNQVRSKLLERDRLRDKEVSDQMRRQK